jgi:two-component system, NtrC family, sensor kinase
MTVISQEVASKLKRRIAELEREAQLRADESDRLRHELAIARDRQSAAAAILTTIAATSGDADRALGQIAETTAHLFNASSVALRIADCGAAPGSWSRTIAVGPGSERIVAAVAATSLKIGGKDLPGTVVAENRQIHIADIFNIEAAYADFPGLQHARAAGSIVMSGTPLRREGKAIGALMVHRDRPEPFTEEELALQQSFADQAAIAIENARLFHEVQARTRERTESLLQQTVTADILKVISRSAFDLQTVLETLTQSAVNLCEANQGIIFLRDGDLYRAEAVAGGSPDYLEFLKKHPRRPGRDSICPRVALSGTVEQIPDVLQDAEYHFPGVTKISGNRALLGVPLLREGRIEGVFALGRGEPGGFTERQVELVQTFADQAVIAIENARLFNEVQSRTQELAKSLDELRAAQDRLVQTEKLASLGQLTAGIAHEIKNPLNFVNNFAALSAELTDELNDVLKPAAMDAKIRDEVVELTGMLKDNLQKVVQHGKRADSIVKNMLLHSREGSGEHRPTDVNALVEESLSLAYHGARAEKPQFQVTIERQLDPNAGTIDVFPQEITRVLLNLISNGFHALTKRKVENGETGFEPMLKATTLGHSGHVEIQIHDNGTGIPPDVKDRIFNPFFTTKPAGEGTGLGLSMSHDIVVKQHGGTIDVRTSPGEFTEFTISLPRTSNLANRIRG